MRRFYYPVIFICYNRKSYDNGDLIVNHTQNIEKNKTFSFTEQIFTMKPISISYAELNFAILNFKHCEIKSHGNFPAKNSALKNFCLEDIMM